MGLVVSPRHKINHLGKNDRNPCLKSHSKCAGQFKLNVCRMIFAKRQLLKLLIKLKWSISFSKEFMEKRVKRTFHLSDSMFERRAHFSIFTFVFILKWAVQHRNRT